MIQKSPFNKLFNNKINFYNTIRLNNLSNALTRVFKLMIKEKK